ncbi:glycine cleavage system aminomethyltransferase GcvT [Rubeoparvulum massiliense]|uniref:glycine cleavage system aminomethyltransferase GcvT n=1 Tax=Rubeoparvulum massiliense TaxID=1631346 RepID=UPI00065DD4CE|nr:glycine cleavage system aminomethyltransferase GcvT [Rubeoparvulum massiliense]
MDELKRTPLFPVYADWGAKLTDFGGWELPVQFSGIKEEHEAVRTRAGLFDVSHMGEILVSGSDAYQFLQKMLTNDLARLKKEHTMYALLCYPHGGTVDDLLVYQLEENEYLLVVNASNTAKDYAWLEEHVEGDVKLENLSSQYALLALQGPKALQVLQNLTAETLEEIAPFSFRNHLQLAGAEVMLSRTGYTGEDGMEIYCKPEDAIQLWNDILEAGKAENVIPCGLGARDTLRFEAKLPLYGQELSEEINPLEAGLGFAVKLNKEIPFIGQDTLKRTKEEGLKRKVVGIEMIGRGIPRHGYPVFRGDQEIGVVTTGTQSPTLGKNVGLALIETAYTELDTSVDVEIRNKRVAAKVVATPFYRRPRD